EAEVAARGRELASRFEMAFSPHPLLRPRCWEALALTLQRREDNREPEPTAACYLLLGNPPEEAGAFSGFLARGEEIRPVRQLKIVGPGMYRIPAVDFKGNAGGEDRAIGQSGNSAIRQRSAQLLQPPEERWSRVQGALGAENWRRLTSLRFALAGVGRTGSLVATSLAKMGVRWLALVDPDRLEEPNLDAMDSVTSADLGRFKVEVLADNLAQECPWTQFLPLPRSVLTSEAVALLKGADVLICCVDNDAARLFVGALACLYHQPLLDIGTGVFHSALSHHVQAEEREGQLPYPRAGSPIPSDLGADVRLILPGDGCLLCAGGVADLARAQAELHSQLPNSPVASFPQTNEWWRERAGSLRSLNQIAVHLGLNLLENLMVGRLQSSVWLRWEVAEDGQPRLQTHSVSSAEGCPLCALAGRGDVRGVNAEASPG
ncbi:MAG TPA: ThiF family adenylyltransferase, partial [Armatimonadetes bacterium]|nr:ThiF family adenylyltransferase [Armatimonadota bacterium]